MARVRMIPLFMAAVLGVLLAQREGSARDAPTSSSAATIEVKGEALQTALPRIGKAYGLRLAAGPGLRGQRVTLFLQNATASVPADALRELLSPEPETVVWARTGKGSWILHDSLARRRLAERLQNLDLELYRQYLEGEVAWLHEHSEREIREAPDDDPTMLREATDPVPRGDIQRRETAALLVDFLGKERRERLLAGQPVVTRLAEMPAALRERYRATLPRFTRADGTPSGDPEQYPLVFLLARNPLDPGRTSAVCSVIGPRSRMRFPALLMPRREGPPPYDPWADTPSVYHLPEPDPEDTSRRVSLNLTPEPGAKPGARVMRDLDAVLQTIARETGLNVVADGYLRGTTPFPANLQVRDYPLASLIASLADRWMCERRFSGKDESTVLVRARHWWLEDQADVPQPLVDEFRKGLGAEGAWDLSVVLRFAELSQPQAYKLVEARVTPAMYGMLRQVRYYGTGGMPVLRFYSRLPDPLKKRMQSPAGLRLREAPPALVERWLLTTLIGEMGALTPEEWRGLSISLGTVDIAPLKPNNWWQLTLRHPSAEVAPWTCYVAPAAPEADPSPPTSPRTPTSPAR